jgi:hypothetical protein
MSSQAMRHTTKEHLAWRHLIETEHPEGLNTHATQADQDLWMSGRASLGSMPRGHDTKNWSHLEKPLARQIDQGPDPGHRRPQMLYELDTLRPQSWALGWEPLGEKFRLPERAVVYDSYARQLQMSESKRLCRHYVLASLWAKPLFDTLSKVKFLP